MAGHAQQGPHASAAATLGRGKRRQRTGRARGGRAGRSDEMMTRVYIMETKSDRWKVKNNTARWLPFFFLRAGKVLLGPSVLSPTQGTLNCGGGRYEHE